MTEAAEEGAEPALAPMEQQEIERRAAVPQACLFERGPLIDAGAHQYDAGADLVGEAHRIRHEPRLVEAPLQCRRDRGKADPHRQVAEPEKRGARTKRTALCSALARDVGNQ